MGVALDDRLIHGADGALHRHHIGRAALALGHHAVGGEQRLVGLLGVGHRIAHGHVLVALDVDHGELLHQARAVLQGHEVGRLVRHVDEQRERGGVAQVLHLALGGLHGRVLRGARDAVEVRLLGALVHQHEADDGVVGRGRGDASVHPHVVVLGDVVVAQRAVGAGRRAHHALLAEERVQPAVVVGPPPVVLLDEQLGGKHAVDPLGAVGHGEVLGLAGGGVTQHHATDGLATEESDGEVLHGTDPPGVAVLIDFEGLLAEHVEGVGQLHVAVDVAHERLGLRVIDGAVFQTHDLGVLGGHVHERVGRDAALAVGEPLEQVGVAQGAHANRRALVVDLRVQVRHLELADVLGDGAHLAVAQQNGGIAVDDGNLRIVHFLDVLGKLQRVGLQHVGILLGIAREDRHGHKGANGHERHHGHGHEGQNAEGLRLTLVLRHFLGARLVLLGAHPENEEQRQQDNNEDEAPEVRGVNVDGRMEPPVGTGDDEQRQHDDERQPFLRRQVEVVGEELEIDRRATMAAIAAITGAGAAMAATAAVARTPEPAEASEGKAAEAAHTAARARRSRAGARAGTRRLRPGRRRIRRTGARAHAIGVHTRLAQRLKQRIQTRLCHVTHPLLSAAAHRAATSSWGPVGPVEGFVTLYRKAPRQHPTRQIPERKPRA